MLGAPTRSPCWGTAYCCCEKRAIAFRDSHIRPASTLRELEENFSGEGDADWLQLPWDSCWLQGGAVSCLARAGRVALLPHSISCGRLFLQNQAQTRQAQARMGRSVTV